MKKAANDQRARQIKGEIREDAERARRRAPTSPQPDPIAPISTVQPKQVVDRFTIAELSSAHYTEFVNHAFNALLRHPPDSEGLERHARLLARGHSKVEVLGNLRYAAEGREIGVRVPWLLPRYLMTKISAIPVLGYIFEWLMCLVGLPRILRHQRAADAYHAARHFELKRELADERAATSALAREVAHLKNLQAQSALELSQTSERFPPLQQELGKASRDIGELRHLVLSVNHWLASLRQNLAALEGTEAEQAHRNDGLDAEVSRRILGDGNKDLARMNHCAQLFFEGLPEQAEVLDIGSGLDWLQALNARNVKLGAIEANSDIAEHARNAGIQIANADPINVLARSADHSLDALSILDLAPLLRRVPTMTLLETIVRVLRPGGKVILGFCEQHGSIIDHLEGRASRTVDISLIEQALQVSGFVDLQRPSAESDVPCIIASLPRLH